MELKPNKKGDPVVLSEFESHLYGIETPETLPRHDEMGRFESHLYGIETGMCEVSRRFLIRLNRTFMELKQRSASLSRAT